LGIDNVVIMGSWAFSRIEAGKSESLLAKGVVELECFPWGGINIACEWIDWSIGDLHVVIDLLIVHIQAS